MTGSNLAAHCDETHRVFDLAYLAEDLFKVQPVKSGTVACSKSNHNAALTSRKASKKWRGMQLSCSLLMGVDQYSRYDPFGHDTLGMPACFSSLDGGLQDVRMALDALVPALPSEAVSFIRAHDQSLCADR